MMQRIKFYTLFDYSAFIENKKNVKSWNFKPAVMFSLNLAIPNLFILKYKILLLDFCPGPEIK